MGQLATGLPARPDSSRKVIFLTSILAVAAGGGWCCAFALGFWVRGLIDADVGRSARAGAESGAIDRPAPSPKSHPQSVNTEPAEPGRPEEPRAKTHMAAVPEATPPAEAAPLAAASPRPPLDQPDADRTPAPAEPERFVLREAAPRSSLPFVLPEKPSFALSDLQLDEPAAGGQAVQVCAVDRSLNTALTWAKSPGAASEAARKEGKLVFLIHVSGNFEDPGFT
jgi:hypothetical protein